MGFPVAASCLDREAVLWTVQRAYEEGRQWPRSIRVCTVSEAPGVNFSLGEDLGVRAAPVTLLRDCGTCLWERSPLSLPCGGCILIISSMSECFLLSLPSECSVCGHCSFIFPI